ncbi:VTT domain-containing protein [Psychrobacter sp. HD31]|uniref:DedA family protein n=1 Tax=Psychrobacter sp. HD31 TaxID=3112003 RepID=UPI003DA51692
MSFLLLFFGALLDALIGANLFIMGEPFLLAAGYQLYAGSWWGVLAVFLGGLVGDQSSYFIGRHLGSNAQNKLINWQPKTRRPIARFRLLMKTKGNYVLIFARLLGPVAWVVPFLAGSQKVSWQRFTICGSIGLFLGVAQWVLWGYLLAMGVQMLSWWEPINTLLQTHQTSMLVLLLLVLLLLASRFWQTPWLKVAMAILTLVFILYVTFLFGYLV